MLRYSDCATPLNWAMTAWSSSSTSTTKQNRIYQFFRRSFNQRRLQLLFAYFFSNWLAVPCFSFWKAFVKCPSLSVNGIFDDVRYHEIWRHLHVTMLQCWAKFSNVLIRRSIRMNRKTMCKCVKVMPRILWLRFSRHGVYDLRTYRSKPIWTGRL